MNYLTALYRKNNFGQPFFWEVSVVDEVTIKIEYGIISKTITTEYVNVPSGAKKAAESRIKTKLKSGYKYLSEIKDNVTLPVEGELYNYLKTYLPDNRTTTDGSLLPMLAKTYDNTNNKLFKNISSYYGQWKINGLRCFVSAHDNSGDMFKPIRLRFKSREGTYWESLSNLEDYLLTVIPNELLNLMIDENYILDGELYIPGVSINELNHFVKDPKSSGNKKLQYWVYDIAIDEMSQDNRFNTLFNHFDLDFILFAKDKNDHLSNTKRLVILPNRIIHDDDSATKLRDEYIEKGFEGLILRNPQGTYQYGKRNQTMIKYKKSTDGKFTIVDIIPEGIKRPDIPLFVCKNDINDAEFECHVGGSLDYQRQCLINKDKLIGKQMYVEYGERSGIQQLPFHVKTTYILNYDNN